MTASTEPPASKITKPEWIVPGAPVLVYQTGADTKMLYETTIDRVAKLTFTLARGDDRFAIKNQYSKRQGGTWGWYLVCIPADSPKADLLRRERDRGRRRYNARRACEGWMRDPSETNRLAAISALTAAEVS